MRVDVALLDRPSNRVAALNWTEPMVPRRSSAPVFKMLGPLEVVGLESQPFTLRAKRLRALLGIFLFYAGQIVPVDRIIDGIWAECPPRSAVENVRAYVHQLRALLRRTGERGTLESHPGGYRLVVEPTAVDVQEFKHLADEGRRAAPGAVMTTVASASLGNSEIAPALRCRRRCAPCQGNAVAVQRPSTALADIAVISLTRRNAMSNAVDYRPLETSTIVDPFPIFRHIARKTPVFWHEPMKSWIALRHASCQDILRDHDRFARDPRRIGRSIPEERQNIQVEDPPEQIELRKHFMRAIRAQDIDGITDRGIEQLADALDARRNGETFDLMPILAPVAMAIINDVVGAVEYEGKTYVDVFRRITRAMDSGLDPSRLEAGREASATLSKKVETWFSAEPPTGMIATLRATRGARPMAAHYVYNTMAGVFNAGFSTLYATTGSLALLLSNQPGLIDKTRDLAPGSTAAHELLRYMSPAQATSRYALVDLELDKIQIKRGQTVVAMIAAANRDPEVFTSPDQIDLQRTPNPHLSFAWGPHVCLGAQLAVVWVDKVARFLAGSGYAIRVDGEPVYMDTATLRNLTSLPVRIT